MPGSRVPFPGLAGAAKRIAASLAVVALLTTACSSPPATCDEVADRTIDLTQDLIDDLEQEFANQSLDEIIQKVQAGDELPSMADYEQRAEALSDRAVELGCSEEEFEAALSAGSSRLQASSELGRFIIDATQRGGL